MLRHAQLAGLVFLGAVLQAAAFAASPFPDQPGALSPDDIKAANYALRMITLNAAQYQLIASGKRGIENPLPAYAVYAMPLVKVTDRITTRRQIVCNFARVAEKWHCTRSQVEARVQARGAVHVFSLVTLDGMTDDGRTAGEIVDYMYSACYGAQHRALAGPKAAPPPNPRTISSVVVSPDSINVMTGPAGAEDTYVLDRKAGRNRQECAFNVTAIHLGKGAALVKKEQGKK